MSLQSSVENYKFAERLHQEIDDAFNVIEGNENIPTQQIDKLLSDLHKLETVLSKINSQDLAEKYSKEIIDNVQHNIDFFYEAAHYIKKIMLGRKYYDLIISPIKSYINRVYYGNGDRQELSKKFAAMLTHKDNIMTFINQIRRIAVGTMSDNEFKKIYNANKHKMIGGTKAFESFDNYL
jgi:hypothetical protein